MKKERLRDNVKRLIQPTWPNEFGTTALVDRDVTDEMANLLQRYTTTGEQTFLWRVTADLTQNTQVSQADANSAYSFQLANMPGGADWGTTFDQYRLRGVALEFMPVYTTQGPNTGVFMPRLWTCIDYDDDNTVTRTQIQQYDSCVVAPPGCGLTRAFVPHIAEAAYATSFVGFANEKLKWIDIASNNVRHYGVKAVIESGAYGQTQLQTYSITATCFWEFKSAR
jgi:hypothetical protein